MPQFKIKYKQTKRQVKQTSEAKLWSSLEKKTKSTRQEEMERRKGEEYTYNNKVSLSNHFHFQYKNKIIVKE